jgi:pimeloyl-ACP methyl ester carboxylesterase
MSSDAGLAVAVELDLDVPSGRLHAQRFGSAHAPLVLCLPGLSANMKSFDFIGERLGSERLQVVALDLRGRGRSSAGGPGTFGWQAHAQDAFDAASALGVERFSLIGHSMGGAVGLQAAAMHLERLEMLALIDVCGQPEATVGPLISAAVDRLGAVSPSAEAYLEQVKRIGSLSPWSEYFERYLRYELEPAPGGGVRARSSRAAVLEDAGEFGRHDVYALWRGLNLPVRLVRAARELLPGYGFIVSRTDRDRFAVEVPRAQVIEVDANHYGIITAEATVEALRAFLEP